MKNLIQQTWQNLWQNKYGFLIYGSLIHLAMSVLGVGFLRLAFEVVLILSGQPNLTKDNIGAFFANPVSILSVIFYFGLVAFLTFLEFSFLILLIQSRRTGEGFSLKKVAFSTLKNTKSLFLGGQIVFFTLYFASMIPLENLGVGPTLISRLKIPDFIYNEIAKNDFGILVLAVVFLAIFYVNLRLIFALPLSVLNEKSLLFNIKKSWQITRKNKLKFLLAATFFVAIFGFVAFGVTSIFGLILSRISSSLGFVLSRTIFLTVADSATFAFAVMSKIAVICLLLNLISGKNLRKETVAEKRRRSKKLSIFIAIVFCGSVIFNAFGIYFSKGNGKILKIAHRGDIYGGVENSLEALRSAKKKGANLIEIDIQMTRDGHFVVIHDANLRRLAGIERNIGDLTLSEIKSLTIFGGGFSGKIPTLEEFVTEAAKIDAQLLIEVKKNGREPANFAKKIIAELRRLKITKKFRLMSMDFGLMAEIERRAPEIKTGVVIPLLVGRFAGDFDFYVIEDFSYREKFSAWVRANGREVFVWTINDRERLSHYLQSNVDGIITDELELFDLVKNNLEEKKFDDYLR